MDLITTTSELAAVCARLARHPVITVDTEFLRETTYYPLLCVVQMASAEEAVVIDTLAQGIDLAPFEELLTVLSKPYEDQPAFSGYAQAPEPHQRVLQTFCGT